MLIQTRGEFDEALAGINASQVIAVDTETTVTPHHLRRRLIGISFYSPTVACYFPFRHTHDNQLPMFGSNLPLEWLEELKPVFKSADKFFIYHNAKFDENVLMNDGFEPGGHMIDTLLVSHMIDENQFSRRLDTLGKKYLGVEKHSMKKLEKECGGWTNIPPLAMASYAIRDTEITYKLWEVLWPLLIDQQLEGLWKDEKDFSRCLRNMEREGVRINQEKAKELIYLSQCRLEEIVHSLGFDPGKPAELARKLFEAQPRGLGLTPGELSTRKLEPPVTLQSGAMLRKVPVLDKHHLTHYEDEVIDLTLEYRGHVKAKSTWFEPFLLRSGKDGRVRADFRQDGTKTHRLSCAEPNMQQLPRTSEEEQEQGVTRALVKTMLSSRPGYELWEFDYSQIELRLAHCYGQDQNMLELFRANGDPHQLTADSLGISRHDGKTLNFAVLYGAGPQKLGQMLEISLDEAHSLLNEFWSAYPGLQEAKNAAERAAASRKYVRYWNGMRRHFEWPSEYHKAFNSVIQGGAGQIVKETMLRFYRNPFFQGILVSQVHDALWFEVPTETRQLKRFVIEEIKETMEWPKEKFILDFPVDQKLLALPHA